MHGGDRWAGSQILHDVRRTSRWLQCHNDRRARREWQSASDAGRVLGMSRFAVRLLYARHDHDFDADSRSKSESVARRDSAWAGRKPVPVHWLSAHRRSCRVCREESERVIMADKYVGKRIKRTEDPRLIKGLAHYVDDIGLPGTLHV